MKQPIISIIAAIGENRELGKANRLLWHIPQDLQRFKQLTLGHPVIMGRKTHAAIGRPLPDRTNIVVTHDRNYAKASILTAGSLTQAIAIATELDKREVFVIGGGQIYAQALPLADRLYLTLVKGTFEADTFFPDYSRFSKIISRVSGRSTTHEYTFLTLEPNT